MEREIQRAQYTDIEATTPQETTLTPCERRFVKDAKRIIGNHLTRTILIASAVLAGAGIVAGEKSGSFDPLASSVNSASHLVLKDLHRAYDQLINELPKVENEEAALTCSKTFHLVNDSGDPQTKLWIDFDPETDTNVNFDSGDISCTDAGQDKFNCSGSTVIVFLSEDGTCPLGPGLYPCTADETFLYDYVSPGPQLTIANWGWGPRPAGQSPLKAVEQEQTADNSCPGSVGGIAELPDLSNSPQDTTSQQSEDNIVPIAAGVAAAAGALTAGGALLYSRRRR